MAAVNSLLHQMVVNGTASDMASSALGDNQLLDSVSHFDAEGFETSERLFSILPIVCILPYCLFFLQANSAGSRLKLLPFFLTSLEDNDTYVTLGKASHGIAGDINPLGFQSQAARRRNGAGNTATTAIEGGQGAGVSLPRSSAPRPPPVNATAATVTGLAAGTGERDAMRAMFERAELERRTRQRLTAIDTALDLLRDAAPGDEVGMIDSMRQLTSSLSRHHRDRGDGAGSIADTFRSPKTVRTQMSAVSTATSVLRRVTASDIETEVRLAQAHMRTVAAAPEQSSMDTKFNHVAVQQLLAELRAAGATSENLPILYESSSDFGSEPLGGIQ
jgi:hypothetical protein